MICRHEPQKADKVEGKATTLRPFPSSIHIFISSAYKDRKELGGRKSRTRETDDAVISPRMTESYERYLPQSKADDLADRAYGAKTIRAYISEQSF